MVLKEDGTKWACHPCLKGHRVSGCDHRDRELVLVPKKGRPVTQCLHCRKERKKRSAHVSCGCGITHTTRDKCIHLREADAHASESSGSELKTLSEEDPASDHACCCDHGGNCTCTGRSTPGEQSDSKHAVPKHRVKPRLTTAQSDPHMTSKAIGVHKPVYHHRTSHQRGAHHPPPRSTVGQDTLPIAQRSMDNLSVAPALSDQTFATSSQLPDGQLLTNNPYSVIGSGYQQDFTRSVDSFLPLPGDIRINTAQDTNSLRQVPSLSQPTSAIDTSAADLWSSNADWANLDWASTATGDIAQSALTYASSNTLSDVDQVTPQEPFNVQSCQIASPESTVNPAQIPDMSSMLQDRLNREEFGPVNRRSLPPSFFGSAPFGFDFATPLESQPSDWDVTNLIEDQSGSVLSPNGSVAAAATLKSRSEPDLQAAPTSILNDISWEKLLEQNPAGDLWIEEETILQEQMPGNDDLDGNMTDDFAFETAFDANAYVSAGWTE